MKGYWIGLIACGLWAFAAVDSVHTGGALGQGADENVSDQAVSAADDRVAESQPSGGKRESSGSQRGWKRSPSTRGFDQPPPGPGHEGPGPEGLGTQGRGSQGRGPGFGRGSMRDHDRFMSPEEVDEFMEFAQEHFPQVYQRLEYVRKLDQQDFGHMLRRVGPPMFHLLRVWREDPVLAEKLIGEQKTEMGISDAMKQYRQAEPGDERDAIKSTLRELLEKKFDYRLERLRIEIENLRKRLDEQTKRLAEREQNKGELINQEFEDLIVELGKR